MAEYLCKEHGVKFFKTPKMKGYAHPIEGTDPTEWCNMPEETESVEAPPTIQEHKPPPKPEPKNKAFALSYAKDFIGNEVTPGTAITQGQIRKVVKCAQIFEAFLDGRFTLGDVDLLKMIETMQAPVDKEANKS